ncbi:MAG: YitT family protein [Bacillota bacterium]|nr:YitT family protein [Bacillota bacterium]
MYKFNFKEEGKHISAILFGSFVISIAINCFVVKAKLLSGGVSGISLIVQYITKFPAGYTILLLNIPLLILSLIKINRRFTVYTIIGTLSLSFFLILTGNLGRYIPVSDPTLLSIYGGTLNGLGIGIVFSNHGSTGGLDIVSALVKQKYDQFEIGTISFSINLIIVAAASVLFSLSVGLYTLFSMYLTSYFVDKVINGFNKKKLLFIISDKEKEISRIIMNEIHRGVTFLYGEGAYTGEEKKILYCVVSLSQVPKVKQLVKQTDEKAFISIMDVSEVEGKGFIKSGF